MIRRLLLKDLTLLWPMAALLTVIQAALEYAVFAADGIDGSAVAGELIRPLTLAWFLGITVFTVAVVQQDPIPGADQDWLVRPLRRRDLLVAKLLFVLGTVSLPMFLLDLAHAVLVGFSPASAAPLLLYKESYVFAFLIVPVFAVAASTRNLVELTLLGAGLLVAYAMSSAVSALLLGAARCATCGTGLVWLEHLLQHGAVLLGAGVILAWQYGGRHTRWSRALLLFGAVMVVFLQLPWNIAFALQQRMAGAHGAGGGIAFKLGAVTESGVAERAGPHGLPAGRQATRALLRGDVEEAVNTFRGAARRDRRVTLDLPLHSGGVAPDELLLVDRAVARLRSAAGEGDVAALAEPAPDLLGPASGAASLMHRQVRWPPAALRQAAALSVDYSLTLLEVHAAHRMPAIDGEYRAADVGICRTRLDQDSIALRCRVLGRGNFCYGATVVGPDGSRNPEVLKCEPDYRPYIPAFTSVFSYSGADLPVRDRYGLAHYPVDVSQLDRSHVELKVYAVREHFQRTVTAPLT